MIQYAAAIVLVLLLVTDGHTTSEAQYNAAFCQKVGGITEKWYPVLYGGTGLFVDCETEKIAYEMDFAGKREIFLQAQEYGQISGKQPGAVIIVENLEDALKALRVLGAAHEAQTNITIEVITPEILQ